MLINKDEYSIRTLAYYQEKGGVYNDILTVMQHLRRDRKLAGSQVQYLNEACFMFDATSHQPEVYVMEEVGNPLQPLDRLSCIILACLFAAFEPQSLYLKALLKTYQGDKQYFPNFKHIIEKYLKQDDGGTTREAELQRQKEIETLREENKNLQDELKAKESQILAYVMQIAEQNRTIASLQRKDSSQLDKALTLRYILDYIKSRRLYSLSDQIIGMLLRGELSRVATDEEYNEIRQVEQQMLDASVPQTKIENHNDIQNSNVFPGLVNNPNFPIGMNPEELIKKVFEQMQNGQNNGQQQ